MKQYIDFFNTMRSAIESNSAPVMNRLREKALAIISSKRMPHIGEENYEITDVGNLFEPDYGINANRIEVPVDTNEALRCDVPNMSTWLYYLCNDTFKQGKLSGRTLPDGVIIDSLREASVKYPELLTKYYGTLANIDDPQVALNTLLAQDGLFIYVPAGIKLERPIQIINILNGNVPLLATRRVLIVADNDSQVKILFCDHTQNSDINFLNNQVIELFAGKGSMIDIYDLEKSSRSTKRISSLYARQERDSNLLINGITLLNGTTRNNFHINIDGEYATTQLLGMAIANKQQHIDNYSYIGHNVPHCHSNELFKYLLDDEAKGSFTGRILVKEGAEKTEAYQSNKNIVSSDRAKMHTKPQLEIYTDDVKCSHGATIGQLDQNALFYMRSRGISESEAKVLLMQAFMSDVIEKVRMDALGDRLRHLVESRLSGDNSSCKECGTTCQY